MDLGNVTLSVSAGVAGRIVDRARRPVPHARIGIGDTVRLSRRGMYERSERAFVKGLRPQDSPVDETDAQGRFAIGDISAETLEFRVDADYFFPKIDQLRGLEVGRVLMLGDIVLEEALGSIDGVVLDAEGKRCSC